MKITLRFPQGQLARFDHNAWSCADRTILACCKMATRGQDADLQTDRGIRTVRRFAARMSAGLTIEIAS